MAADVVVEGNEMMSGVPYAVCLGPRVKDRSAPVLWSRTAITSMSRVSTT